MADVDATVKKLFINNKKEMAKTKPLRLMLNTLDDN